MIERVKTSSYFVTICKNKNNTFIRRIKRKGLHAYPRTLTLKEINNVLKNTNIKYPRLLKDGFKYVNEEYIEATKPIEMMPNSEIENNIINILFQLNEIEIKNKKIIWNNNSEFLKYIIENFERVLKFKSPKDLEIYLSELEGFYKYLDNDRKMCFIHGDIHKKNIILNDDNFYLIDWELATYGDLAYELSIYFILMEYTNNEKEMFLNKLNEKLNLNLVNLKKDIEVYTLFEQYRQKILKDIKE